MASKASAIGWWMITDRSSPVIRRDWMIADSSCGVRMKATMKATME